MMSLEEREDFAEKYGDFLREEYGYTRLEALSVYDRRLTKLVDDAYTFKRYVEAPTMLELPRRTQP
jgi:hypothetical protein